MVVAAVAAAAVAGESAVSLVSVACHQLVMAFPGYLGLAVAGFGLWLWVEVFSQCRGIQDDTPHVLAQG